MDEERYQLLGDSSLYTKSGKKKKPFKGELEQMLGAPTEITYKAGGGAEYILEAGAWMAVGGFEIFFVHLAGPQSNASVPMSRHIVLWQ